MERSEHEQLRERARHSYERGRVRLALALALLAAAPLVLTLSVWPQQWSAIGLCAGLYGALAWCTWRGGEMGRGAIAGLIAGSVPVISSVVVTRVGHLCAGGLCISLCVPICFFGGILAGGYVAWRGQRGPGSSLYWAAAAVAGSLTAAMGCIPLGVGATVGLMLGFVIAAVPGRALARHTRS